MRLHKKLYLPYELIGMNGGEKIECYLNESEASGL